MEAILKQFDLVPTDLYMIIVGALCFVVFWQFFGNLVAKPFAALIQAREKATIGADVAASATHAKAAELRSQFEQQVIEERVKEMRSKFEALAKAKAESAAIIAESESKAQAIVQAAKVEAEGLLRTLRQQAVREADSLAQTMAEKAKNSVLMQ